MRPIIRNFGRFFIYHPGRCRNHSIKREGSMLGKMIAKAEKKKNKKSTVPEATSLHQYARHTLCCSESRRKSILNKIIMDQISDLMTTGVFSDEIYDHSIHVTQTKITANYHLLYVYWIHTKDINESEVNVLLKKIAAYFRQELTSARIMGEIPEVRFVKDEEFMKIQYTEEILNQLRSIENEEVKVTDQSSVEQENVSYKMQSKLPPMGYNIFGLEYLQIMNNIKNQMRKCGVISGEEVSAELEDHKKESIEKYDKKELARVIFSKRYEMKKFRRSSRVALEPALVEDDFDDETNEDYEDWPAGNDEIDIMTTDPEEDLDEVEARRVELDEDNAR